MCGDFVPGGVSVRCEARVSDKVLQRRAPGAHVRLMAYSSGETVAPGVLWEGCELGLLPTALLQQIQRRKNVGIPCVISSWCFAFPPGASRMIFPQIHSTQVRPGSAGSDTTRRNAPRTKLDYIVIKFGSARRGAARRGAARREQKLITL